MLIRRPRGWEIPERLVTPEAVALGRGVARGAAAPVERRAVLAGGLAAGFALAGAARAEDAPPAAPARNPRYEPGRAVTGEREATTYNNFYEFNTSKDVVRQAQRMPLRPWTVRFDGMVERPREMGIEDILRAVPQEERVYRHRCVEAWAMTVPWSGFALSELVKLAAPTAGARYVVFETAQLPAVMPGLRAPFYSWPYVEGLTLAEANNELAFVATGLYGRPLLAQNGASIRLVTPWKYGFKSIKSIVRVTLTDRRPTSFWEGIQPQEYGFWANVNPAVPHPRWSQASERLLGTSERVPTQLYNGYGEFVAGLYTGLQNERLFV
ncbi:protein-methionine-sulfoxide reductase catalytic subunit MsrP [Roseomonas sp. NAR14]|uniref:Protein-methionine-sulfoxide reductase catalytic subunit MsrP n=1 Tax=Roseomonas acroporae TaxID=2937791 RepID=A0A9X2BRS6_9PROT|nr:protein-methionine-sulfoxide reductase catalytic subunit MsrP [Roseomonas acroporae]MCK8782908.1 protein-methionine-sulfoxide reductase catalytic subunit MsrP [Roseomonas acroporae]